MCNAQMGGELWERICPGWKNDGKENVWGGKMTGGNIAWVEKRLDGICPRCQKDGRVYVREGFFPFP